MRKITNDIYAVGKTVSFFDKKYPRHTSVKNKRSSNNSDTYASWGDGNLGPQNFYKNFVKTDAAVGGLDVLVSAHYGTGFKLHKEIQTEKGVDTIELLVSEFPDIFDFFDQTRWQIFMSEIVSDFETFNICYPEFLLSPDKNKIISVKRHQAAHCRLGVPNEKNGLIENVYVNADWENYDESYTETIRFFNPEVHWEEIKEFSKRKNIDRFIIPVIAPLTVEKMYPVVKWHSSFRNGWVDVVLSVPEFKKYMFENQINLKYLVYVADDFFSHKYGQDTWREFPDEKKEALRVELVTKIDKHLSGNESSGRSLVSPYFRDRDGKLIKGIEIEAVDDKIKDGNFLPDAASGNSQILFSMGVDPCLLGAGIPGGKNLSGSGSDKREAYTILCTRMPIRRIRTLEIFARIRNWNGWPSNLIGKFPNINLTTLDKNPNGQTEIIN
ncbi:hypothetical protein [Tenacibaculum maritimum]|uniref:hypothetical protein n=1 Tax=Tenacibaculum maritimum TaxID=107401 RepID=UPI0012E45345|nr:hypothetical protein [Tenacibaculum maritimum]CAA0170054.1 conserved hypothetical protein. Putative prophage protein [Tenacibaculum maritimum]CAA0172694.1 conserved hypothetical protein [Tenacibaculum maritimum]CAA0239074.1 conserved hypothetical protein [Tenacibaculum maritimum]